MILRLLEKQNDTEGSTWLKVFLMVQVLSVKVCKHVAVGVVG